MKTTNELEQDLKKLAAHHLECAERLKSEYQHGIALGVMSALEIMIVDRLKAEFPQWGYWNGCQDDEMAELVREEQRLHYIFEEVPA